MPQTDSPLYGHNYTRMYNAEQGDTVLTSQGVPLPPPLSITTPNSTQFSDKPTRVQELTDEKRQLIAYLESKVRARNDWHAVQDAASDIREIDAKLEELAR